MGADMAKSIAICAVGDELLAGAHPDLNSPFLARALLELGHEVRQVIVVGDDEALIAESVKRLARSAQLVFVTGGLGPTLDDVTRHGVARAVGSELVTSPEALAQIEAWYASSRREMPSSNLRQALVPKGGKVLFNPIGTAPGFEVACGTSRVLVLPGPPVELQAIWSEVVEPLLIASAPVECLRLVRSFHLQGLSESVFADQCGDWMGRDENPLLGVTVARGVLTVRCVARGQSEDQVQALLDVRADQLRQRFDQWIFSQDTSDPAEVLVRLLEQRGETISCAESCTGGLLSAALTGVPGVSAVFSVAHTVYSAKAKQEVLGVSEQLLRDHGAVSEQVAGAMALGAAERTGAHLALSISGIAGPEGGTPERPVGLVTFGVCYRGRVWTEKRNWAPLAGRARIRVWATSHALVRGVRALEGRLDFDQSA
jgi:nicotinamide-nucleotide amidase